MGGNLEPSRQIAFHFNDFDCQVFEEVTSEQQISNSINMTQEQWHLKN